MLRWRSTSSHGLFEAHSKYVTYSISLWIYCLYCWVIVYLFGKCTPCSIIGNIIEISSWWKSFAWKYVLLYSREIIIWKNAKNYFVLPWLEMPEFSLQLRELSWVADVRDRNFGRWAPPSKKVPYKTRRENKKRYTLFSAESDIFDRLYFLGYWIQKLPQFPSIIYSFSCKFRQFALMQNNDEEIHILLKLTIHSFL